jgi:hypothetical protein
VGVLVLPGAEVGVIDGVNEIVGVAVGGTGGFGAGVLLTTGVFDGVIETVCVGVGVGGISFQPIFLLSSVIFT